MEAVMKDLGRMTKDMGLVSTRIWKAKRFLNTGRMVKKLTKHFLI